MDVRTVRATLRRKLGTSSRDPWPGANMFVPVDLPCCCDTRALATTIGALPPNHADPEHTDRGLRSPRDSRWVDSVVSRRPPNLDAHHHQQHQQCPTSPRLSNISFLLPSRATLALEPTAPRTLSWPPDHFVRGDRQQKPSVYPTVRTSRLCYLMTHHAAQFTVLVFSSVIAVCINRLNDSVARLPRKPVRHNERVVVRTPSCSPACISPPPPPPSPPPSTRKVASVVGFRIAV